MKPYYQDDFATVFHGRMEDILPALPKSDCCLTDPPFGMGSLLQGGTWGKRFEGAHKDWDSKPASPEQLKLCQESANESIIWGGNFFTLPISRGWLVWDKGGAFKGRTFGELELAWTSIDMVPRSFVDSMHGEERVHPTQKPINLMLWCLSFVPECKTMVDPFAGSMSSLVAAKSLGIRCIGVEQSEEYCEAGAKRLQQEYLSFSTPPIKPHEQLTL